MARLADLGRHDVDVDREEAAFVNRSENSVDCGFPVTVRNRGHRVLHQVRALLIRLLELVGVERRLVVVAVPDVVDAAPSLDEKFVDIGRRPRTGIVRAHIAFLVAAEPDDAAAHLADIAGGERDVHISAVGAVVVVAPNEALFVTEHHAAAFAALFRHGDPFGRLDDVSGVQAGNLGRSSIEVRHPARAASKLVRWPGIAGKSPRAG